LAYTYTIFYLRLSKAHVRLTGLKLIVKIQELRQFWDLNPDFAVDLRTPPIRRAGRRMKQQYQNIKNQERSYVLYLFVIAVLGI
jgi:hypothetical protein